MLIENNIPGRKVKKNKTDTDLKPVKLSDNSINVLFIDVEKHWRGGHSQLAHLLDRLSEKQCNIYLVCREGGALWNWAEKTGGYALIDLAVSISFIKYLNKLIKNENIQIVHAQSSKSHDIALLLKILNPQIKLVVSRRVDFHRRGGFYNKWKYSTHLIDMWIAVSKNVKNVLQSDGADPERIKIIHDGVDTGSWRNPGMKLPFEERRVLTRESLNFQIREINKERRFKKVVVNMAFQGTASAGHHETNPEFMIRENDFLFGIIAALVEHKDHENLLNAFSIAITEKTNLKLLIVGDGKLWGKLDKMIGDLGLHSYVHMLGFRTDVAALMKLFDGFVLSSQMDGLGSSLIDAMAAGLPIVCTDAGGFPEIIENGRNGIIVPKKNSRALADAMISLSRDKTLRKEMKKNNIKDSLRFDAEIMMNQTWETYLKLLQKDL